MNTCEFDENEVRKHFKVLGHEQQNEWMTNIVAFGEGGLTGSATVRSEDDYVDFCRKHAGNADIYAGANPVAEEPEKGKLREGDVEAVTTIPLDFDAVREKCPFCDEVKKITGRCGGCGNKIAATGEELEKCVDSVEDFIDENWVEERPTYGVTGNGVQVLASIPPVDMSEHPEITEKFSEFQDRVKEEAKSISHVDFDKVGIARVVRVWGTPNISAEEAEDRQLRTAKSIQAERRESEDLRDFILELDISRASPSPESLEVGDLDEEEEEEFRSSLRQAISFSEDLWNLWNGNWSEVSDGLEDDRSKREAIFAKEIVERMGDVADPASVVSQAMKAWPHAEKWCENEFHRKSAIEWALKEAKRMGPRHFINLPDVGAKLDLVKKVSEERGTFYELKPFGSERKIKVENKGDFLKDSFTEMLEEKFSEWWDVEGVELENLALKAILGVRKELKKRKESAWKKVSDGILEDFYFVAGEDNHKLRVYEEGVYVDKGEEKIAKVVEERMGAPKRDTVNEIVARIERRSYTSREEYENPPHLVNVRNGLLNPEENELYDHTPEHISLSQLPVKYG